MKLRNISIGLTLNLKEYEKTLSDMAETHVLEKQKLQKSIDKLIESKEQLKNELELNNQSLAKTNVELKIKNKIEEKSVALQKTIEQLQASEKELLSENKILSNKIGSLEKEITDLKLKLSEKKKQIFNEISSISTSEQSLSKNSSSRYLDKPSSFLNISTPRKLNDESANAVADAFTNNTIDNSEQTNGKRSHHRKKHSQRRIGEESTDKNNTEKNNNINSEKNDEKGDKVDLENSTSASGSSQRRRRRRTHSSSTILSDNSKITEIGQNSSFIIENVFDIEDDDENEINNEKDSNKYLLPKSSTEKDIQREIDANQSQKIQTINEEKTKIEKKNSALKKTIENHEATIRIMQEKIDSQIVLIETMLASSKVSSILSLYHIFY